MKLACDVCGDSFLSGVECYNPECTGHYRATPEDLPNGGRANVTLNVIPDKAAITREWFDSVVTDHTDVMDRLIAIARAALDYAEGRVLMTFNGSPVTKRERILVQETAKQILTGEYIKEVQP